MTPCAIPSAAAGRVSYGPPSLYARLRTEHPALRQYGYDDTGTTQPLNDADVFAALAWFSDAYAMSLLSTPVSTRVVKAAIERWRTCELPNEASSVSHGAVIGALLLMGYEVERDGQYGVALGKPRRKRQGRVAANTKTVVSKANAHASAP